MKTKSLLIFKKSYLLFFLVIFIACFSLYGQQKEVYKDNIQADVNAYLGEYSTLPIAQGQHSILLFKLNGKMAIKFFRFSENHCSPRLSWTILIGSDWHLKIND